MTGSAGSRHDHDDLDSGHHLTRPRIEDPGPTATDADPGMDAVHNYYATIQIDPEWCLWDGRGFTWWAYRHPQRVWAEEAHPEGGEPGWRIIVETDLFRVADPGRATDGLLSAIGPPLMAGLVRQADAVRSTSAAWVHEENLTWTSRFLQIAGLIQLRGAERLAGGIAEALRAEPLVSAHPYTGPRPEPDEMLEALDGLPVPPGWDDPDEYQAAAEDARGLGIDAVSDGTSLRAILEGGSILAVRSESHPVLGPGMSLLLQLSRWPEDPPGRQIFPVELDALEHLAPSGAHVFGGWSVSVDDADRGPFFSSFVPAALLRSGVLANLVLAMALRARWVARWFPEQVG